MNLTGILEITTIVPCSVNCSFCPQSELRKAYHGKPILTLEDYKAATRHVPTTVEIEFSGFSEPFLNPYCIDMIEYTHQQGHKTHVNSTLVGLKLQDIPRLKTNLDELCVHLPDNHNNAKIQLTQEYKEVLAQVLRNFDVQDFTCMNRYFFNNGRAGLIDGVRKRHLKGWYTCPKLRQSQHFVMLPNADRSACCMDFELKHILGNLLTQSYQEIIDGKPFKQMQRDRWSWDSSSICRDCYASGSPFKRVIQRVGRRIVNWGELKQI